MPSFQNNNFRNIGDLRGWAFHMQNLETQCSMWQPAKASRCGLYSAHHQGEGPQCRQQEGVPAPKPQPYSHVPFGWFPWGADPEWHLEGLWSFPEGSLEQHLLKPSISSSITLWYHSDNLPDNKISNTNCMLRLKSINYGHDLSM